MTVLPRATPESQGVSSRQLLAFIEALSSLRDPHGMVLVRHGHVIAEAAWAPYRHDEPQLMFSLSKSFASTAIGFAVDEGLLGVEDRVVDLLPDDAPVESDPGNVVHVRVKHLLAMTTGHAVDSLSVGIPLPQSGSWASGILSQPFPHTPGTVFVYNSGATYLLSAIITKVTGQSLLDYLGPRLMQPLGIEGATWSANDEGINFGGWGLSVRTEDAAKLGVLYLQRGAWNGKQLLSSAWVTEATGEHSRNADPHGNPDWVQGYGYQFWRCQHGFYRADGAFGQYSVVMEHHDAVLALTSGVDNDDLQTPLNVVWSTLLPAFHDRVLAEDPQAHNDLVSACARREISMPSGSSNSPNPPTDEQRFLLQPNSGEWVSVDVRVHQQHTRLRFASVTGGSTTLTVGHNDWSESATLFTSFGGVVLDVRAKGAWHSPVLFAARMSYNGSPFTFDFTIDLSDGAFALVGMSNVGFAKPFHQTELRSS
jgi:CubicO group peptidase (beta-lactamase class C family)